MKHAVSGCKTKTLKSMTIVPTEACADIESSGMQLMAQMPVRRTKTLCATAMQQTSFISMVHGLDDKPWQTLVSDKRSRGQLSAGLGTRGLVQKVLLSPQVMESQLEDPPRWAEAVSGSGHEGTAREESNRLKSSSNNVWLLEGSQAQTPKHEPSSPRSQSSVCAARI